jgi:hypothetical protein
MSKSRALDKKPWDHDACVECPVSGHVWEDVLRNVAVWSYRVDARATRFERVCKRWKHYWQVAEGVFNIDMRAMRIPKKLYPFAINSERSRLQQQHIVRQFQTGQLKGVKESRGMSVRTEEPPWAKLAEFAASWPSGGLGHA